MVTHLDPVPLPPPVDRRAAAKAARKEAAESRVTPGAVAGTDPGPRLERTALEAPGWPTLPASDAPNFTDARPMTLAPGTKIYRIIDDGSNPAGSYWAFSIPASEASWRAGNGHVLPGGEQQIWMPPGAVTPSAAQPTPWARA